MHKPRFFQYVTQSQQIKQMQKQGYQPSSPLHKSSSHEERLKYCKRIYDQLHHNQFKTFVIRKAHLENYYEGKVGADPKIYHSNHLPIFSVQKIKSKSESKHCHRESSANVEFLKRLLYENKKPSVSELQQNAHGENGGSHRASRVFEENGTTARKSRLADSYRFNSKYYERVSSHISSKEKSREGSPAQQNSPSPASNRNHHRVQSKIRAKKRKQFLPSANNKSMILDSKLNKEDNTQGSNNKVNPNKPATWLQNYMSFIHCQQNNREFLIHLNFDAIRKMKPDEAWMKLDLKNAKIIEGMMSSLASISPQHLGSPLNAEPLKETCRLYFNNHEKARMELILKEHYFKLFAFKLKPIFVYQRIILYFTFMLLQNELIGKYAENISKSLAHIRDIYKLIIQIITDTENQRKGITKGVNETFKILRSVGEVERRISQLDIEITHMVREEGLACLSEINKMLKPFLVEQHHGNRSYQSFIKMQMYMSWKYLQVPPTPFLPIQKPEYLYTLVIDLDETLIYFNSETNVLKYRPGLDTFFKIMRSLKFEIVVFTASSKMYADAIIKEIQSKGPIFNFRLYKEHLTLHQGRLIKDIRRLGRDLSKTIIIDDLSVNFNTSPENGIEVSSWLGNKSDRQLINIVQIIQQISTDQGREGMDLRAQLKKHRKSLMKMIEEQQSINQFLPRTESNAGFTRKKTLYEA